MLVVLGASHHDLELTALERLSAQGPRLRAALADQARGEDSSISGAVVLATCNRLEVYVDARRFHDAIDEVTDLLAESAGVERGWVSESLTVRVGAPVAAHLFTVAAGLDSMVVGEAEISGQVAKSLAAAASDGTATPVLHSLFQSAARTAKKVVSSTELGSAGRSVASVAIDLAIEDRAGAGRALVIGTGAYARVVAGALRARGWDRLSVFSPSGRAAAFARTHQASVVTAAELPNALRDNDVVVTCSGHAGPVITAELVRAATAGRPGELVVVDLSLTSDVEPAVAHLPGVRLVDLHTVARNAAPEHRDAITAAQDVVIAAVARFEEDQAARTLDPAVVALRSHVSQAVEREVSRLRGRYSQEFTDEVEQAMRRVTQSLLHTPTLRARKLARNGDGADYLNALHTLFGIELPGHAR